MRGDACHFAALILRPIVLSSSPVEDAVTREVSSGRAQEGALFLRGGGHSIAVGHGLKNTALRN